MDESNTIQEHLDYYLQQYDFGKTQGGYQDAWVRVSIGLPIAIWLPNIQARKAAVPIHDVGHILTGYRPQNPIGEMEQALFELASGCHTYWFAWMINLMALPLAIIAPRRAIRAFRRGRKSKSLYKNLPQMENLHHLSVSAVRKNLGIQN